MSQHVQQADCRWFGFYDLVTSKDNGGKEIFHGEHFVDDMPRFALCREMLGTTKEFLSKSIKDGLASTIW